MCIRTTLVAYADLRVNVTFLDLKINYNFVVQICCKFSTLLIQSLKTLLIQSLKTLVLLPYKNLHRPHTQKLSSTTETKF